MHFAEKVSGVTRGLALAFIVALALPACSQSGPSTTTSTGGAGGGTASSGGTTSSGGATSSGGTTSSGGATASGGATNSGGVTASGGQTTVGSGGTTRAGGATGSGGVTGDGGTAASGGATARGGATGSGGAVGQGGGTGVGGGSGTGGVVGSGGETGATGGSTGSGGSSVCAPPTVNLTGADAVADGPLITFNSNGGWCWYQDERAVVDVKGGKLVIGSVAFPSGDQQVVIYDLKAGTKSGPTKIGNMSVDDHNAPALIVRPDGGYAAMWAGHNQDCKSYFSTYSGTSWAAQKTFDWTSLGCPTSSGNKITYANMWYLGTDLVSFVRSVDTSPNYLISKDNGASWSYGGRLTSTPQVGYVAGYYKYWGNNTDRIDFFATEAHPRDNDNSLYHGYIKDGKIYNSGGTVVDATLADKTAQEITKYTQVFKTGSTVGGVRLEHAWNADLVRYDDGTIAAIWTARVTGTGSTDPDKRLMYARYDGSSWKLTYLAKAGTKLYADEQDYTGLGALHPDDPTTIYLSTPYNPSTDTMASGARREIWRGTTCDNGATFKWTPVTANSTKDNYRPIVPKWDAQHTALLWMKGTYETAQRMTMAIVGTITGM
jgi:hypothetical protein